MSIQVKLEEKPKIEQTIVDRIDGTHFYNLMQDVSITKLLIDVRDKDAYDLSHAKAAISIPIDEELLLQLTSVESLNLLAQKNSQFRLRGLLFKTIVLINENPEQQVDEVCNRVASLLYDENKAEHVYILEKYTAFSAKYPFLCTTKEGGVAFHKTYPSEIINDFLYLGDRIHSSTRKILDDLNIRYILNMAHELGNEFEEEECFFYEKLGVGDTLNDNIRPTFERAVEFIRRAKNENARVLVHCNMGVSRSTTALLSYLMIELDTDFETAFAMVKEKRSIVHPNATFREQLIQFHSEKRIKPVSDDHQSSSSSPTTTDEL
jgi:rhodanese-related sulfurtransferase